MKRHLPDGSGGPDEDPVGVLPEEQQARKKRAIPDGSGSLDEDPGREARGAADWK